MLATRSTASLLASKILESPKFLFTYLTGLTFSLEFAVPEAVSPFDKEAGANFRLHELERTTGRIRSLCSSWPFRGDGLIFG